MDTSIKVGDCVKIIDLPDNELDGAYAEVTVLPTVFDNGMVVGVKVMPVGFTGYVPIENVKRLGDQEIRRSVLTQMTGRPEWPMRMIEGHTDNINLVTGLALVALVMSAEESSAAPSVPPIEEHEGEFSGAGASGSYDTAPTGPASAPDEPDSSSTTSSDEEAHSELESEPDTSSDSTSSSHST
jgi:hypothetical protein